MKHNDYWSALVKCPFFKKESAEKRRIVCEGISEDTRTHLVFLGSEQRRQEHLKIFCCDNYEKCAVYAMAMKKWEDEYD